MPAYNFQLRFVEPIRMGRKPHTIRMPRKRPTVAGDWIYMYTGLRTKAAHKFAESIVVAVTPIIIFPSSRDLLLVLPAGNLQLNWDAENKLAQNDGFPGRIEFFDFFEHTYKKARLDMEIIEWDVDRLVRC